MYLEEGKMKTRTYSAAEIKAAFLAWGKHRRDNPDVYLLNDEADKLPLEERAEADSQTLLAFLEGR